MHSKLVRRVFVVSKIKNIVLWTCVISDLSGKLLLELFMKKKLQKTNQIVFRIEKVLKRKCDKLYGKWNRCDNSINSSINKDGLV